MSFRLYPRALGKKCRAAIDEMGTTDSPLRYDAILNTRCLNANRGDVSCPPRIMYSPPQASSFSNSRVCYPARVRHRGRRCLQQGAERPRRAASQEPRLLQSCQDHQRTWLGCRPRRRQCRRRGVAEYRIFDTRWVQSIEKSPRHRRRDRQAIERRHVVSADD
jgi:hypothetical protein